jgi:hypothetical protein
LFHQVEVGGGSIDTTLGVLTVTKPWRAPRSPEGCRVAETVRRKDNEHGGYNLRVVSGVRISFE